MLIQEYLRLGEHQIKQLPGASELIHFLKENANHTLGIVMGNHQEITKLKLQSAGLDLGCFLTGAYGRESADRSDLVPLAQKRAETITGKRFPEYGTIVIGDKTRDVLRAQSVGATSFALTSGTDDREMLSAVNPDYIFDEFQEVLALFLLFQERSGGTYGI